MARGQGLSGSRPPSPGASTISILISVAAVVAVVAVLALLLLGDGDDPTSQAGRRTPEPTGSPAGSGNGEPASPGTGGTGGRDGSGRQGDGSGPSGDADEPVGLPDGAPGALYAVSARGVERVDARTGERTPFSATKRPEDADEPVVSAPAGVDVWPGRDRLAVDMCCEPVPGSTFAIGTADPAAGALSLLRSGAIHPAVSPDGDRIALSTGRSGRSITIIDRDGNQRHEITAPRAAPGVAEIAWSPDGGRLAFEWGAAHAGVWVIDADATDLADAREVALDPGVVYESPAFRADGMLVVARSEPPAAREAGDRDDLAGASTGVVLDPGSGEVLASFDYGGRVLQQDYDASGTYLVFTLADGRVRWTGGGASGTILSSGSGIGPVTW